MLGALWYLQRRLTRKGVRRRAHEEITVLGRQGLGGKAQLVVVRSGGVRYVLGVTEHGVNVIDRADDDTEPEPEAEPEPGRTRFDDVLEASTTPAHVPERRVRTRGRTDPLRGSILSPDTWRQSADALRRLR